MRISTHRRLLTGLAVVVSLALGVSACGGGDEGEQAPPAGQASGEIRVVSNWTGSEGEAFQAVIDAFKQKNPQVTVKIEPRPCSPSSSRRARRRTSRWPCPASSEPSPARTCC